MLDLAISIMVTNYYISIMVTNNYVWNNNLLVLPCWMK